jgi:hypothetical protein
MTDVDAAKLPVMLTTLRLPTISRIWQEFGARADREGWGSARFLAALCEHELADRQARCIARHMAESSLPQGNSFATFDFAAVPTIRKAHVMPWPRATPGSSRAPIFCYSAPAVPASRISRRRSAPRSSTPAGASSSPALPISCRSCKRRGAT